LKTKPEAETLEDCKAILETMRTISRIT